MKLKNKRTGEIMEFDAILAVKDVKGNAVEHLEYDSIQDFTDHWEDVPEEPLGWCITMYGGISRITKDDEMFVHDLKEIGNHFNDKESTYDTLDKLKAWTRLKSCGFKFTGWRTVNLGAGKHGFVMTAGSDGAGKGDLDLLFGGEE